MKRVGFIAVILIVLAGSARGMFAWNETKEVPIGTLFTNLQQKLARNSNDFETVYHLARLHAMAYASNTTTVSVIKKSGWKKTGDPEFNFPGIDDGTPRDKSPESKAKTRTEAKTHLTNAIALYERATQLLKTSTNKNDAWLVLPLELGHAWCLDQSGKTNEAIAAYRKTLDIAWHEEVVGDFKLHDWVTGIWSDVRAGENPFHSRNNRSLGPGICFSEETIRYLLKLLDPKKDAAEIKELKARQNKLAKMGRMITPILIPLEDGLAFEQLINTKSKVSFDLDGTGQARRWGWITPKAAWLVYDSEHHGEIKSALQMFGTVTFWMFWRDGYDALSSLDRDGDGWLKGEELNGLALWQDINEDGISNPGEVRPVSDFGIVAINCAPSGRSNDVIWNEKGVSYSNGHTRASYDWVLSTEK